MKIPIKVTGANQVLPVKFNLLCCFSVSAITFTPPQLDFGTVFNQSAASSVIVLQNHSLLPQQFSFVRLPKEISVNTDAGTGSLLPGEKYSVKLEYRPSLLQTSEDSTIYCRIITGKICVRELKLGYTVEVTKCPLICDKRKIEFPALPETEFNETVFSISNHSTKEYMIEMVPPNLRISGLLCNPLVSIIKPGGGALMSMRYNSKFRDLTYVVNSTLNDPIESDESKSTIAGLVNVNKKLAARLEARKKQAAEAAPVEAKGKGGKGAPAAKEAPPAKAAAKGKGGPTAEEEAAEAERVKREAELAEQRRIEECERNFDRHGELLTMGGKVADFDRDEPNTRS